MVARLVAEEGDLKGLILSLDKRDIWVIGRDPDQCQLIVEDPLVSRRHLIARRTTEGIVIENLSSTNPVQINEEEIHEPRLLKQGDTVRIGSELFRFYSATSAHLIDDDAFIHEEEEGQPYFSSPLPSPSSVLKDERQGPTTANDYMADTIYDDEDSYQDTSPLAEINFGLAEVGRWLLKVVTGPNVGAEFYMQNAHSYTLGTDPHSCDIVFHDTSVSRQHARITVTNEDTLFIEDLKSRNGVLIGGKKIEDKQPLSLSVIVTLGTTSFVIYDREGEMNTIISPLLPSIVKVLQQEETVPQEEINPPLPTAVASPVPTVVTSSTPTSEPIPVEAPKAKNWGPTIFASIVIGLFLLAGMGSVALFKNEPVQMNAIQANADDILKQALAPFPAIKYSFNRATGSLLLFGHVENVSDKNQLTYTLQGLKFVKSIDDSGLIIDDFVWQEINSILSRNPDWKEVSVHSPAAGQFILSGHLQTRKQAQQILDYISVNFPYVIDLLKVQVVVDESISSQVASWLRDQGLPNVTAQMTNGELTLNGTVAPDKMNIFSEIVNRSKNIPGVRIVTNLVKPETPEVGIINLTGQYEVTGQSRIGNKYTVVINGRILSEGDSIDGYQITQIRPNVVFLEREGLRYRIDYQ